MGIIDKFNLGAAILLVGIGAVSAKADVLYNDIPTGTNSSSPDFNYSVPFAEDQVSAFGGLVSLNTGAFTAASITGATVALSNWAQAANYAGAIADGSATAGGYSVAVTLSIYNIGNSLGVDPASGDTLYAPGSLITSSTTTANIGWVTPTSDGGSFTCTDGSGSAAIASDSAQQCGQVNLVNFSFSGTIPTSVIYTVSFSTGQDGSGNNLPSDSLNLGLTSDPAQTSLGGIGMSDPDTAYYFASATSGLNPLSGGEALAADTGWSSYGYGAVSIEGTGVTPEPATFGLIGIGLVGFGFLARKKKKTNL